MCSYNCMKKLLAGVMKDWQYLLTNALTYLTISAKQNKEITFQNSSK